jgi:diaminopimelate epimerase
MAILIPFFKASGAGNDFVLIDNMSRWLPGEKSTLARAICDRNFGVGGDGLLVIEPARSADFTMLYFNADGSFGGMCGNGGRCAAMFAFKAGYTKARFSFRALHHTYRGEARGGNVRLEMKDVSRVRGPVSVHLGPSGEWACHYVDSGSPHVVSFCADIQGISVHTIGKMLRGHKAFGAKGVNVNFVRLGSRGTLEMRTYERGVEAETLACGTGAIACALAADQVFGLESPVRVKTRSGRVLNVGFRKDGATYRQITLEGEARIIFNGNILYDVDKSIIDDIFLGDLKRPSSSRE